VKTNSNNCLAFFSVACCVCITLLSFLPLKAQIIDPYITVYPDPKESTSQYQTQLEKARDRKDYQQIANAYFNLANIETLHDKKKNNVLEYYNRSIEYYKLVNLNDSVNIAKLSIAREYYQSELYEDAKEIITEVLADYEETPSPKGQIAGHLIFSDIALEQNNYRKYEEHQRSINNLNIPKDDSLEPEIKLSKIKGLIYGQDYELADILLKANIQSYTLPDSSGLWPRVELLKAEISIGNEDYKSALGSLTQAEQLVKRLPLSKLHQRILAKKKECYSLYSVYDSAYLYAEKESKLKDSLKNRVRMETVSTLSEKYKSKEKSTAIKVLEIEKHYADERNEQQSRALYVLVLVLLLLSSLIYATIRFYKKQMESTKIITMQNDQISKQKISSLEGEIKLKGMHSMIEGQESERERISKDLHDSLGGLLSTIKLQLDHIPIDQTNTPALAKQQKVQNLLDSAVNEVRSISSNLQPVALKNLGLVAAVSDLISRYRDNEYPEIEFQHYDVPKPMDNMVALSVYRIIQELINNTVKHGEASEVDLQLRGENSMLVLQYEDDGKGFDLESLKKRGMGLENITSRVNYLKGEMSIDARIGQGVSYIIHIQIHSTPRHS